MFRVSLKISKCFDFYYVNIFYRETIAIPNDSLNLICDFKDVGVKIERPDV